MQKTILITGSTDGIGLETAKSLAQKGHHILLHGRNEAKLEIAEQQVKQCAKGRVMSYVADLSRMKNVSRLANQIREDHERIDVLINNAGVLSVAQPMTDDQIDIRFVVNTLAPYLLTRQLMPLMDSSARIVNLSSAAQAPVNLEALAGETTLDSEMAAYSQSKLAITMWSRGLALELGEQGPLVVAVNPGSLLATKMVKEGFGIAGSDLTKGSDILVRAALSDEFSGHSGAYFDNDSGAFAEPHPDGLDKQKISDLTHRMDAILSKLPH